MRGHSGAMGTNLAAVAIGAAALAATLALTPPIAAAIGADVGDLLTRNTVRLSLAWYVAAVCMMLFLGPADWAADTTRGPGRPLVLDVGADLFSGPPGDGVSLFPSLVARPCV